MQLQKLYKQRPVLILDEIHKHRRWKNFVKGFYDTYADKVNIIITGSAKLNIYKSGSDSLMGRYFPYRVSPMTVGECVHTTTFATEQTPAKKINSTDWKALLTHGGFPEPF